MEEDIFCTVCGKVDNHYDEYSEAHHIATPKHQYNLILKNYKDNKKTFTSNRDGIFVYAKVVCHPLTDHPGEEKEKTHHTKIRINVKPNQEVKYLFEVSSDNKKEDILIVGIQLAHPQPQFKMNDHCYIFGKDPHILKTKSTLKDEISVKFSAVDIGQYEMPIVFTFLRPSDKKKIIIIREMVVMVQDTPSDNKFHKSPFTNEDFRKAHRFIQSNNHQPYEKTFKIPKTLKKLLPWGLNDEALDHIICSEEEKAQLRQILIATRSVFEEGITEDNYVMYFHYLLWWEEIITRINLRKYNMNKVKIDQKVDETYWLEVPGLAEKRPSLLRGDRVFVIPITDETKDYKYSRPDIVFECIIGDIKENSIKLTDMDELFEDYYLPETLFCVKFLMSRVPVERMHAAVSRVFIAKQGCRVFPVPNNKIPAVERITKFYNELIKDNEEQRSAVEHILSKSSGKAPYIVFGPPGTGKTMTIVEAIIQIVTKNPKHRVMVCTDSNMAADHIAVMLLKYNEKLNINNYIFRANSQNREWSTMPPELRPVSNGDSYDHFYSVDNAYVAQYKILVTTLLHAAKYGSTERDTLKMSHLFIDEAAQAKEPAALVPISNLLAPSGQLVLAGDPKQLGPVCLSKEANARGLGTSLLERLWNTYTNLYRNDPNYITVLVKNFRSDPDILKIPNELFYSENPLQPQAEFDPISRVSILGTKGGERAITFHSVNSREQRMGNAPSFFNEKELLMMQRYIIALTREHDVVPEDIGVIAPYIRQVYKMRDWLKQNNFEDIEIGTVEAFQGKEKRVILVSTVRANCKLLDYDAKYGLGFLVDDKRFNVALTRAKAKVIIIGNPVCLTRDAKWRLYMDTCKDYECYFGKETEQLERNSLLLKEVAKTRFERCYLREAIDKAMKENANNNNKTGNKKIKKGKKGK